MGLKAEKHSGGRFFDARRSFVRERSRDSERSKRYKTSDRSELAIAQQSLRAREEVGDFLPQRIIKEHNINGT